MTYEEFMRMQKAKKPRKKPTDEEHRLQAACFKWFCLRYPRLHGRLFAVPNGGARDAITGRRLKEEGVVAGVADLILLISNDKYGALLIEMKTETGRQSESQKAWEAQVTADGDYKYVICRSIGQFIQEITNYLTDKNQ